MKKGFRKQFLNLSDRQAHADRWSSAWQEDYALYAANKISPAELCARIVLEVYDALYPDFKTNGKRQSPYIFEDTEDLSAIRYLNEFRIRSFPETAAQALLRWANGGIQLQVFESIPDPLEVLRLQSQGVRCLSIFWKRQDIIDFEHEGRDFFSFLIHDLIHAELMTKDAESYSQQKKFAHFIYQEWEFLKIGLNPQGLTELEYMASDMNSHIVHLLKTFKSWIERHRPDLKHRQDWIRTFSSSDHSNPDVIFNKLWQDLDGPEPERTHLDLMYLWRNLCPKTC